MCLCNGIFKQITDSNYKAEFFVNYLVRAEAGKWVGGASYPFSSTFYLLKGHDSRVDI